MDDSVIGRVRRVIEAASESQAVFAGRVGLTPDKLSKSLKGVRRFTSLDLALIAEAGSTTVDWILTGREPLRPAVAARTHSAPAPDRVTLEAVARRFTDAYEVLELLGRSRELPEVPGVREDLPRFVDQGDRLATEALARLRRAGLGSPAEQSSDMLVTALEKCFGVDIATEELPRGVDGLAWQTGRFRLVLLRPTRTWTRQRFTLAHEIGHILARDAQDLLAEAHLAPGRQKDLTEIRANVFASHLLMPADEAEERFRAAADDGGALSDEAFQEMVVRFKVSPSALAARLHQLGLVGPAERNRYRRMSTESCHMLTGSWTEYQRQESWACAKRFPVRVASELFEAYRQGDTTLRPLAALLDVEVDRLHDLLDPTGPTGPASAVGLEELEEGDLVFQP
ncbi:ImmA/IrrE family metallo-endopeptidase [Streptomyces sp. NPDC059637]|uniref:ImmA/IrrE family metallo-endopeptidase n=1 Tax=Streptomyces sp. NPDC059637 TaxID=3347752 RepID=UPI003685A155